MKHILILFLFIVPAVAHAQRDTVTSKNAIYVEYLGSGLWYSVNYDRRIASVKNNIKWNGRIGYSYYDLQLFEADNRLHNVVLETNLLWGHKSNFFETGLSYCQTVNRWLKSGGYPPDLHFWSELSDYYFLYQSVGLRIGYRHQHTPDGLLFRAAFTPLAIRPGPWMIPGRPSILPWFGISVGHAF